MIKPLRNALATAEIYGFAVIPVHGNKEFGGCTCGKPHCNSCGKHPVLNEWQHRASKDPDAVTAMFAGLTDEYNYGIATGPASGVFVVDVDGPEGQASLEALEAQHGKLPATLQTDTGRGKHLFFKYPETKIVSRSSKLGNKLDAKGEGGQVVGPGSTHYSGTKYQWHFPGDRPVEAPEWLIRLASEETERKVDTVRLNLNNQKSSIKIGGLPAWTQTDVMDMLDHIHPDAVYDEWLHIGMAIHSYGLPFAVFDDWSRGGTKYNAGEAVAKWNSFKKSGISIGTIYHHAVQGGWKPRDTSNDFARDAIRAAQVAEHANLNIDTDGVVQDDNEPDVSDDWGLDPPHNDNVEQSKLPLVYAGDVQPVFDTQDFVENLLCRNQFSVIYGESNCGKTFFMLDLAMHVALGKPWRGLEVEQGGVIYCALEGGHGTMNRVAAFKNHHGIEGDIPLAIIPASINFMDAEGDISSLVQSIAVAAKRIGNVKMVIIDTLARAMSGADENSGEDMGKLVINADMIRAVTGAHIAFVHHSGKDALKGARGHSSLRAAVDTEIEISRTDETAPSLMRVVKQREIEMIPPMSFKLERVMLGENSRGKDVSSCVVIGVETVEQTRIVKMTPMQQFIYDALVEAMDLYAEPRIIYAGQSPIDCVSYDELRKVLEKRGFKELLISEKKTTADQVKSATNSARIALKKQGRVNMDAGHIWTTMQ